MILDDLDCDKLHHFLKIWCDRYKCKGEVKGASLNLNHKWFIVTSNQSIEELFENFPKSVGPIKRRFE